MEKKAIASFDIGIKNFAFYVEENDKPLSLRLLSLNNKSKEIDINTRKNLILHLNEHKNLWDCCSVILIEQQYTRRSSSNITALKIAEDVIIWFLIEYPETEIISFSPKHKTSYLLGAPKKMTYHQRKKWSVSKALSLFNEKGYDVGLINQYKKKDDICDCILQTQAFKQFKNFN